MWQILYTNFTVFNYYSYPYNQWLINFSKALIIILIENESKTYFVCLSVCPSGLDYVQMSLNVKMEKKKKVKKRCYISQLLYIFCWWAPKRVLPYYFKKSKAHIQLIPDTELLRMKGKTQALWSNFLCSIWI